MRKAISENRATRLQKQDRYSTQSNSATRERELHTTLLSLLLDPRYLMPTPFLKNHLCIGTHRPVVTEVMISLHTFFVRHAEY